MPDQAAESGEVVYEKDGVTICNPPLTEAERRKAQELKAESGVEQARQWLEQDGCENPNLYASMLADYACAQVREAVEECAHIAKENDRGYEAYLAIRERFKELL
jgi:hypothetical protein